MVLPEFDYRSHFIKIGDLKVHYIDEGPANGPAVLFLHGVPTWSYSFRKVIPVCLQAGHRVICPDLPGFGYSDKPHDTHIYHPSNLVSVMTRFTEELDLDPLYLFAHDWGAIIGLGIAAQYPQLFRGLIICNGTLPEADLSLPFLFNVWKTFAAFSPWISPGRIVQFGTSRKLSVAERNGYDLPFPGFSAKFAIRVLPSMIPFRGDDLDWMQDALIKLHLLNIPLMTVFSDRDPITRNADKGLREKVPGALNQPHRILRGKHFLQEDRPFELGKIINEFISVNEAVRQ